VEGIKQALDRLKTRLGGLTFNQKLMLGVVAAAGVISIVTFSLWLQQEEMAVLFTNLDPADAQAALQELAKQDVKTELADGGTTVLVPEAQVHRLRVDLAAKGVPASGVVGFEIFDGKQYGLTDFLQNVNFKRALEGELTKTIEGLAGINSARVHLVLPKPSIFKKLASEPTASVVLGMSRTARVSEHQIAGIQSLVSGSVEGLAADAVTVLDQHGTVLSNTYADDAVGRTEGQLALKKEVEGYLVDKAQTMLAGVLGEGRSLVRVDATLNFEKIETERTVFDPKATVVRSEERQETTDPEAGNQESSITNYEINQTVEHIIGETGGVKSLSVAVFVDGTYPATGGEAAEPAYQPRPQEELDDIRRVVQTALGLDAERGDQIEVVGMQFRDQPALVTGVGGLPGPGGWLDIVGEYGGRVLLSVLLGVMLLVFKKNLSQAVNEVFRPLVAGPGDGAGGRRTGADGQEATEEPERFEGMPDVNDQMIEDVREYAAENPQRVAEVVQSWLHEPERNASRT